ncbi:uncharacterized protein Dsimw501_GD29145 [Drosophila simulans]|uniref:Uncharacterized protein n=1 Tax=Drosophila simulans TaxID=7240 RepID=A0A0J9UNP0_DROSI|nr:uncharacterized protein Dsimw501_GD29145 [Drosophila simulans]
MNSPTQKEGSQFSEASFLTTEASKNTMHLSTHVEAGNNKFLITEDPEQPNGSNTMNSPTQKEGSQFSEAPLLTTEATSLTTESSPFDEEYFSSSTEFNNDSDAKRGCKPNWKQRVPNDGRSIKDLDPEQPSGSNTLNSPTQKEGSQSSEASSLTSEAFSLNTMNVSTQAEGSQSLEADFSKVFQSLDEKIYCISS